MAIYLGAHALNLEREVNLRQNVGHMDLANSSSSSRLFDLFLEFSAGKWNLRTRQSINPKNGVYTYTAMRISQVSELKVKTNRRHKIFKNRRNRERKFILPNILETEFTFILEYSKYGSRKK
jgi:hypothetical protein